MFTLTMKDTSYSRYLPAREASLPFGVKLFAIGITSFAVLIVALFCSSTPY